MKIGFRKLIEDAEAAVDTWTIEEARAHHENEDFIFVDIRDVRELWREGMIEQAIHAPRGMLEFWAHPESPYHKPVFAEPKHFVLYCASGWRSALAAKALQDMGMKNVSHIGGGFTAWRESGGPIVEKERD